MSLNPEELNPVGASPWAVRINASNKLFTEWYGKFRIRTLEDYYRGNMWKMRRDYPTTNYLPYTLNLIYSTIKIKLATLLFQRPKYLVSPRPANAQYDLDFAVRSAQLKEDVLNTIVSNPNIKFTDHIKLAARDSFFSFGLIEVGYANDWRNPQKVDPRLESWEDPDVTAEDDRVIDENAVPINERFYIKRIRPDRFRVAVTEAMNLDDCDWCGYFDYYNTRTLMYTKGINWPEGRGTSSYINAEYAGGFLGKEQYEVYQNLFLEGELSRVWHIWDNVARKRLLLLDDDQMSVLWEGPFDHLPLIDLRWDLDFRGWYPIPPVFQWLSPQDEINEAREQVRSYRRRFTRKFQTVKGLVDEEEKEKFSSGPDGILIEVKQPDAIKAIDNPEIGPTSENALTLAKDDFNIISGTSAEARGQDMDRETATQAKIVDVRAQIRESSEQLDFGVWLAQVGRELLSQCQSRLVEGLWIKYTTNPSDQSSPEIDLNAQGQQSLGPVYKYVTSQQIDDGYDYEVEFDVQNATPAAMQAQQQSFVNFMNLLNTYPMISMNPVLIREAAYRVGYRNEAIIKQTQDAAVQMMKLQAAQAQMGGQQGQQNAGLGPTTQQKQMATPSPGQINAQLTNQLQ